MKKLKGLIAVMLICLFVFPATAFAAGGTVDTFDAIVDKNKVTVSGKVTGILACAVCVYDETGTTLKALETCQVKSDNTYSYTLQDTFADGKYMVTIADYNGGTTSSKIIEIKTATTLVDTTTPVDTTASVDTTTKVNATSPETGDTALVPWFVVLAGIGACGVAYSVSRMRKVK